MKTLPMLKTLLPAYLKEAAAKKRLYIANNASGFTLIEVLVVVILIGILSAIAAPGWSAFIQRQRLSKVNDAVLSALQQAQTESKRTKQSYSVSFKVESNVPKVAIYRSSISASSLSSNDWRSLSKDLEIKQAKVLLGTNLSGTNTADTAATSLTVLTNSSSPVTVSFDYLGAMPVNAAIGTKGLIIGVGSTSSSNALQVRKCVKVITLLGMLQSGNTTECNPS
jgi:prepilin-type N-terminal cleavage/methylation domain-containing protein